MVQDKLADHIKNAINAVFPYVPWLTGYNVFEDVNQFSGFQKNLFYSQLFCHADWRYHNIPGAIIIRLHINLDSGCRGWRHKHWKGIWVNSRIKHWLLWQQWHYFMCDIHITQFHSHTFRHNDNWNFGSFSHWQWPFERCTANRFVSLVLQYLRNPLILPNSVHEMAYTDFYRTWKHCGKIQARIVLIDKSSYYKVW